MKIVVLEGLDGAGKSTILAGLKTKLEQANFTVFSSASSGGTSGSQAIRKLVKDSTVKLVPEALCLMFAAGAADVANQILEAGKTHDYVLLDRWHFSSVAYQGAHGVKVSDIQDVYAKFVNNKLALDYSRCFYIDVSKEERKRRMNLTPEGRILNDRYETMGEDFTNRVQSLYERQIQMGYLQRIGGERHPHEIIEELYSRIHPY